MLKNQNDKLKIYNLMTNTTDILINQVNHLETTDLEKGGMVKRSEVVDLIRGVEEELNEESEVKALETTLSIIQENINETDDVILELERACFTTDEEPFLQGYNDIISTYFLSIAEEYRDDLHLTEAVIKTELETEYEL